MAGHAVPAKVRDFYVLPIKLPIQPSFPSPAIHYLYFRPDEPRIPDIRTSRSLFLANIPFDSTDTHLKHLFSAQLGLPSGRIEDVSFESCKAKDASKVIRHPVLPPLQNGKKRKRGNSQHQEQVPELGGAWPGTWDRRSHPSGSSATLSFVDKTSMEIAVRAARKATKSNKSIIWGEGLEGKLPPLGYQRYLEHHRRCYPPKEDLLKSVNDYMAIYAAREAELAKLIARQRSEPDADGFITVTRGGRNGAVRQEEALGKLEKQKQKQKGFDDFYRFQSREKRKQRANDLIKKFQEDKEKVRKMKEQKGHFRPE